MERLVSRSHECQIYRVTCSAAAHDADVLDDEKVMSFRGGVKWLPAKNTDVFFITLNKSDKDYSPTTIYNDIFILDKSRIRELFFQFEDMNYNNENEEWI